MNIKIKGSETDLKFTFNSFKYMEDFDIGDMNDLETKPFKVATITEVLLLGAVNHNPRIKFSADDVSIFLEEYVVDNSIGDLMTELMEKLQDSNFFKSLQKAQAPLETVPVEQK